MISAGLLEETWTRLTVRDTITGAYLECYRREGHPVEVNRAWVPVSERRQGILTQLLFAAEEVAREARVGLEVWPSWKQAEWVVPWLLRRGYEEREDGYFFRAPRGTLYEILKEVNRG